MEEFFVKIRYEQDEDSYGIGVWVTEQQVGMLKEIAKRNKLYMVIEQDFDFTGEE